MSEFTPEDAAKALVGKTMADVERLLIEATLAHCHNNRLQAAAMLDISDRTLRNKLNAYKRAES